MPKKTFDWEGNLSEIGNCISMNDISSAVKHLADRCSALAVEANSGLTPSPGTARQWRDVSAYLNDCQIEIEGIIG